MAIEAQSDGSRLRLAPHLARKPPAKRRRQPAERLQVRLPNAAASASRLLLTAAAARSQDALVVPRLREP